jgi:hypothetical protein
MSRQPLMTHARQRSAVNGTAPRRLNTHALQFRVAIGAIGAANCDVVLVG